MLGATSSAGVRAREATAAASLLALLLLAAFPNVVFLGKSLVYSDNWNPLDPPLKDENYGKSHVPASAWQSRGLLQHPNVHDPGATLWQWEPFAVYFRNGLAKGELPFWDPYSAAGTPAMANLTGTPFFPPYLAVVLLGNTPALKNAYFLGLLLSSGFVTYLLLRRHTLSPEASLFGAAIWMLSGALIQNAGSMIGQTAACIPFVLFLAHWLLESPSPRRTAWTAAGFAAVSLSSFPPVLFAAFGLTCFYAAIWVFSEPDRSSRARLASHFTLAAVLAIGLVAFYFLPFLTLLRTASYALAYYRNAGLESISPELVFSLLSPRLFWGGRVLSNPIFSLAGGWPELHYLGVTALALALGAARPVERLARVLFHTAWATALLALLKIFGVPPVQWIGKLPVLGRIHFWAYFGILVCFLAALLAAFALDALASGRLAVPRWLATAALPLAFILAVWRIAATHGGFAAPTAPAFRTHVALLLTVGAVATALGLGACLRRRPTSSPRLGVRRACVLSLGVLACLEGIANASYPRQYRWDAWRHPVPYMKALMDAGGLGRAIGIGTFSANAGSAFGVFGLDSLMALNPPRLAAFYREHIRTGASSPDLFLRAISRLPKDRALDVAGIEHVVLPKGLARQVAEAESRGYSRRFEDSAFVIFQRRAPPRFFVTSAYRVAPSGRALDLTMDVDAEELVLEERPSFLPIPNSRSKAPARVLAYQRNRCLLEAESTRPAVLFAGDSLMPGWSVHVNGQPARLLAANYAFRAVEIPAGKSRIEFRYIPPGLNAGLAISGAALLAGVVMACRKDSPTT